MKYDPDRKCPKCDGAASTWFAYGRMERSCQRCGYRWHEDPLDTPAPPKEEGC